MTDDVINRTSRLSLMRQYLYAAGDITPEYLAYTRDFCLEHKTIQAHAGVFAICLVNFRSSEKGSPLFDFDEGGLPAAVIEVILFNEWREPYVADLVAWPLHNSEFFATGLGPGEGAGVLGAFHMPQRGGSGLWVHRTPLTWLQSGCEGCVPLKANEGSCWLDRAGGPFIVGSVEDGRWLRSLLSPFPTSHRILVSVAAQENAA